VYIIALVVDIVIIKHAINQNHSAIYRSIILKLKLICRKDGKR